MKRALFHTWLGTSVLASVLAVGCNQAPRRSVCCSPTSRAVVKCPSTSSYAATSPAGTSAGTVTQVSNKEDKRRSYGDITADPAYARAPDYGWLVGELNYVHVRDVWRIRYASVDEEDRYGGSVTLTDAGPMTGYTNGQIVKVEGSIINPESREPSPAYRVRSIQLVTR